MITEIGKYYLYRHIRLDKNEPFYIGIGTKNIKYLDRKCYNKLYGRAFAKTDRSGFWKKVISKTDYSVEILLESDDYEFIKQKEIEFISFYGRRNLGKGILVNLTDGGDGNVGLKVSQETIEKIRKSRLGKKASEETKIKFSTVRKNEGNSRAIPIVNTLTGQEYGCIKQGAESEGISGRHLANMLQGKHLNTTYFVYKKDYDGKISIPKFPNKRRFNSVINIKTRVVYKSLKEASEKEEIDRNVLYSWLNEINPDKSDLKYLYDREGNIII